MGKDLMIAQIFWTLMENFGVQQEQIQKHLNMSMDKDFGGFVLIEIAQQYWVMNLKAKSDKKWVLIKFRKFFLNFR